MRGLPGTLSVVVRSLLASVTVTLVFAPALMRAEGMATSLEPARDPTEQRSVPPVAPQPHQDTSSDHEDEIPDWVWGAIGGSAGAAVAAALGYSAWLRRRGRD